MGDEWNDDWDGSVQNNGGEQHFAPAPYPSRGRGFKKYQPEQNEGSFSRVQDDDDWGGTSDSAYNNGASNYGASRDSNNDWSGGSGFGDAPRERGRGRGRGRGGFNSGGRGRDGFSSGGRGRDNFGQGGRGDRSGQGGWDNHEGRRNDNRSGGWSQNNDEDDGNKGWAGSGEGDSGWNDDSESGGGGFGGRGRGRGRGRGGREGMSDSWTRGGGGRGRGTRDRGGEEDLDNRPPPYIPPDRSANVESMFDESIGMGVNFDKYEKIPVDVSGNDPPGPIDSFETSGLGDLLLRNVAKAHYTRPTPIQKYALPICMAGRDLMGCAQTGSGKTAAFLLPIIQHIITESPDVMFGSQEQQPLAVIISPTRELAIQICNEAFKFSSGSICKVVVLYGGTSVAHQSNSLMQGCHIVVATPGRFIDFMNRGKISFKRLKYLVLDEADKMLEMGFMEDIRKIVDHPSMPEKGSRQTLMFSATFPEVIQHLAAEFLHDYLFLTVGIVGGANNDVTQTFFEVGKFDKRTQLEKLLKDCSDKTLVFVETKKQADFLAAYLSNEQYPSTSIHGDRYQHQREEALADFKSGKRSILIATAVAARGLDIRGVGHVINYDLPGTVDEYVHRIGRTGRVGNIGRATSFFDNERDSALARALVKIMNDAQQDVPDFLMRAAEGTYASVDTDFMSHDIRPTDSFNSPGNMTADEVSDDLW